MLIYICHLPVLRQPIDKWNGCASEMVRFYSVCVSSQDPLSFKYPFLTNYSQNCNMFYRRIINFEDEEISVSASMPPRDSDSEARDRRNNKHKAIEEVDSESDEEDYRGLSRIAPVSRRKRTKVAGSVGADCDDKHIEGNKVISSEQDKSKSNHNHESSYTYYRRFQIDEDEDEYVEVNGVTYVIPARSRSKRRLNRRDQISDTFGSSPGRIRRKMDSYLSEHYISEPPWPQDLEPFHAVPVPFRCVPGSYVKKEATDNIIRQYRIPKDYSSKNHNPTE